MLNLPGRRVVSRFGPPWESGEDGRRPDGVRAATLKVPVRGVERAGVLLSRDQALTSRQHRAVAAALARIGHHLRDHAATDPALTGDAPGVDAALARFAHTQLTLADTWLRAGHLWCTQPGSWQAPTQLQAAAQLLADHPGPGLRPGQVRDTARLLPDLADAAARNLTESLTRDQWLAAHPGADGVLTWAVLWPDYGSQPFVTTSATADPAQVRRAWQAAGVAVRAWRMGDLRDQDPIVAARGVQDLARINVARDAVIQAGQALRGSVGGVERSTTGPETVAGPPARDILRDCPAPLFPRGSSQPASAGAVGGLVPDHLTAMTALIRDTLPADVAAAVLADPQWTTVAGQLYRADQRLHADGTQLRPLMEGVAGDLSGCTDPATVSPARLMIETLHTATAAPGPRHIARAHTHLADQGHNPPLPSRATGRPTPPRTVQPDHDRGIARQ
jgi:hypothetical protein